MFRRLSVCNNPWCRRRQQNQMDAMNTTMPSELLFSQTVAWTKASVTSCLINRKTVAIGVPRAVNGTLTMSRSRAMCQQEAVECAGRRLLLNSSSRVRTFVQAKHCVGPLFCGQNVAKHWFVILQTVCSSKVLSEFWSLEVLGNLCPFSAEGKLPRTHFERRSICDHLFGDVISRLNLVPVTFKSVVQPKKKSAQKWFDPLTKTKVLHKRDS